MNGAKIDAEILQSIAETLRTDGRVRTVEYIDEEKDRQTQLLVMLDKERYPPTTESVRIEIQWYRNGWFNVHHIETHESDTWQCRWDRHANTHSSPAHFHPPPDAGEPVDASFPEDYRDVVSMVLATVENRVEALWS